MGIALLIIPTVGQYLFTLVSSIYPILDMINNSPIVSFVLTTLLTKNEAKDSEISSSGYSSFDISLESIVKNASIKNYYRLTITIERYDY